jgi:BarA-like signal transduction histidine kinase
MPDQVVDALLLADEVMRQVPLRDRVYHDSSRPRPVEECLHKGLRPMRMRACPGSELLVRRSCLS